MPFFSVIIPAYNSQSFLGETLESLRRQTLGDFEAVIVNDGSTDDTGAVIDAYCEKDPRFRCLTQENAGVSAARNNGLAAATGEYVAFLDADDSYAPDTLEAFYRCIEKIGADLVLGRLRMVEHGRPTVFHAVADELAACGEIDRFDRRLLWNFLVNNKCYRRSMLMEHGVRFPASGFSEEGAFFMDAVYSGLKICGTMESVVYYRRHTDEEGLSVSQTANEQNLKSLDVSMRHIYAAAKQALQRAGKEDRGYLEEILYKHLHILVSQFYRELWRLSDETLSVCASQISELLPQLSKERQAELCSANPDLNLYEPCASKAQAAARPVVSLVVKRNCSAKAAKALFLQTAPLFELLLTKKAAEGVPPELLAQPNVTVTDGALQPNSPVVVRFGKLPQLEPGVLLRLQKAGLPQTALTLRLVSWMLKRRHGA